MFEDSVSCTEKFEVNCDNKLSINKGKDAL